MMRDLGLNEADCNDTSCNLSYSVPASEGGHFTLMRKFESKLSNFRISGSDDHASMVA